MEFPAVTYKILLSLASSPLCRLILSYYLHSLHSRHAGLLFAHHTMGSFLHCSLCLESSFILSLHIESNSLVVINFLSPLGTPFLARLNSFLIDSVMPYSIFSLFHMYNLKFLFA